LHSKDHHHHEEGHLRSSEALTDIVIGMSDGLTVPFALAAGLTGGLAGQPNPTSIIVTAGLAEIAAGSIAMSTSSELDAGNIRNKASRFKIFVCSLVRLFYAATNISYITRLTASFGRKHHPP